MLWGNKTNESGLSDEQLQFILERAEAALMPKIDKKLANLGMMTQVDPDDKEDEAPPSVIEALKTKMDFLEVRFSVPDIPGIKAIMTIEKLMREKVSGAGKADQRTFDALRPMTFEQVQKKWDEISPLAPLMTLQGSKVDSWEEGNTKFIGMRHVESGKKHGFVRQINKGGWISEGTYRDGNEHGLVRSIHNEMVCVSLFRDKVLIAQFQFKIKGEDAFKEVDRSGDEWHLLDDMTSDHFNPKVDAPQPRQKNLFGY